MKFFKKNSLGSGNDKILGKFNRAKKSLGQNFLNSAIIVEKIVEVGEVKPTETILEAGPGRGVLTELLLKKAMRVVAVEKDDELIGFLNKKFAFEISSGKFELVHKDILEFNPEKHGLENGKYKIIANIPYYITGIFLKKFLSGVIQPSKMVLMVQKEVAERIVAKNKKESILSLSVKVYGMPKYIQVVKACYFSPQPKVDSAIISIENISKSFFDDVSEKDFFDLIKTSFAGKRKILKNNLKIFFKKRNKDENFNEIIEKFFNTVGLSQNCRAEDIPLEKWKEILSGFINL